MEVRGQPLSSATVTSFKTKAIHWSHEVCDWWIAFLFYN
jgi:hypothetical protein